MYCFQSLDQIFISHTRHRSQFKIFKGNNFSSDTKFNLVPDFFLNGAKGQTITKFSWWMGAQRHFLPSWLQKTENSNCFADWVVCNIKNSYAERNFCKAPWIYRCEDKTCDRRTNWRTDEQMNSSTWMNISPWLYL